jgi:hypothetical protein
LSSTSTVAGAVHSGGGDWNPAFLRLGLIAAVAAVTTIASTTATVASCDNNDGELDDSSSETTVQEQEELQDDDPYDNLPTDDEPTHCSICKTYRQGPCRPYWRKVEACTKENESVKPNNDDDDDTKDEKDDESFEVADDRPCIKYIMPWIDCASSFRNLYNLIELDTNYTLGIEDLEADATQTVCWRKGSEPVVDWKELQDYATQNPDWNPPKTKKTKGKQTPKSDSAPASSASASAGIMRIPLWKTLNATTSDPELINITVMVNIMELGGAGVLECAYALDQNENVIGFAYGNNPSQQEKKEGQDGDETAPYVTLTVRLLPNRTSSFTIGASYLHDDYSGASTSITPEEETEEEKKVDLKPKPVSHIYKSRLFSLRRQVASDRDKEPEKIN